MVQYTKPDLKKLYDLLSNKITPTLNAAIFPGILLADTQFNPCSFFSELNMRPYPEEQVKRLKEVFFMDFKKIPLQVPSKNPSVHAIAMWRLCLGK